MKSKNKSAKQTLSLKSKLFGFSLLAILFVLVVATTGAFYYRQIGEANSVKQEINLVLEEVLNTRMAEKAYLQFYTEELKQRFEELSSRVMSDLDRVAGIVTETSWKSQIGLISGKVGEYRKLFQGLADVHARHGVLKGQMTGPLKLAEENLIGIDGELQKKQAMLQMEGDRLTEDELGMLNVIRDCRIVTLQLQAVQQQFLMSGDEKLVETFKELSSGDLPNFLTALEQFAAALKNDKFMKASQLVKSTIDQFLQYVEQSQQLFAKEHEAAKLLDETGKASFSEAKSLMGQVGDFATAKEQSAVLILAAILAAGILAFLVFSYFFVRSITRPVKMVIDGLRKSAEQVASVSQEVATSSHRVSAGASSQAAGIEETSSSLEEMASMTRQNAQNAEQAAKLAKEANQTVLVANGSMTELAQSVGQISQSSEETFKIIKTIDEIAFQTNLLALNAAVEAARAGEAGAGFAVVADEVRNLAMRAADAAKNTASLIEDTVKKVKEGTDLAEKTNQAFAGVAASTQKVGELVGEITAASEEQAQGIDQVNKAISEMDKVTQENAANSEELASASEEMSSQAREMKGLMDDLVSVVDGRRGSLESSRAPAASPASSDERSKEQRGRPLTPRRETAAPKALTRGQPKLNPAHIIPLRAAKLEDF